MAKASPIYTNFTAGEISPKLKGRVDFAKYANGCDVLDNFVVMVQGGATKRSGTYFASEAKFHNKDARLIPFVFSTVQAYMLEVGDLYFRIFKDGGRIESPPGTPVEVVTVYPEAAIRYIKYAQNADLMYLANPDYRPYKITRTGHTAWSITAVDFQDGPYLDENNSLVSATTLTPSAATGTITVTASGTANINDGQGFLATDVGRLLRVREGTTYGWGKITARASTTSITVDVITTFTNTSAKAVWALGAWSDTTGWPSSVSFNEDRLVWGGNDYSPQTIWFSKTGQYEIYSPSAVDGTVTADMGMSLTLLADQVNAIRWISSGDSLSIGTGGGEFVMSGSTRSEAITPTNVNARRHTTRGSYDLKPIRIDAAVLYWQRAGRKLREFLYDFNRDANVSIDISVLGEHMTFSGPKDWDFQQEPHAILWICRNDGVLVGCTYNKEQDVVGWHRHTLGGTQAKAISVGVIPAADYDEVWLLVQRVVDSATVKYIEYMVEEFSPSDENDKDQAFFVDCGLTYDGTPTTTVSGLDHLIGETVSILADGAVRPSQVVSGSGEIVLTKAASVIHVGLGYNARLATVQFEAGGDHGTSQGKIGRVNRVGLRFLNTLGGSFGPSETNTEPLTFRSGTDPMDSSPPLFTGDKIVTFSGSYGYERRVVYVNDQPYPATLLAVMPEGVVYG
jgi:hypothetical protein